MFLLLKDKDIWSILLWIEPLQGIFTGSCGTKLDHGINNVGYDSENGLDYWMVRNSWGTTWGEQSYMKLQCNVLNPEGLCGVNLLASYPIKKVSNPPIPNPTRCDDSTECNDSDTACCCAFEFLNFCLTWGCCTLQGAVKTLGSGGLRSIYWERRRRITLNAWVGIPLMNQKFLWCFRRK